jgi:hypothetical protein
LNDKFLILMYIFKEIINIWNTVYCKADLLFQQEHTELSFLRVQ